MSTRTAWCCEPYAGPSPLGFPHGQPNQTSEELREILSLRALPGEEEHDYHTAAGMVIARFGRIPHAGEYFDWHGWRLEVVDLDGARIDKLLVARIPAPEDADAV